MLDFLTKLFKPKKVKDVEELIPKVKEVNQHFRKFASLSDDELRQKTIQFKDRIREYISEIQRSIDDLQKKADEAGKARNFEAQEGVFEEIDKLKKLRNQALEEVLMEILPEAFAVVKETARRFVENKQLVVRATEWDLQIAARKNNVIIDGDTATWLNHWAVAGNEIVWDMVHYDVQLMGGMVLHQGKISEMATGEGKTLVSTLPSYLNALTGMGVHIVTVNDYLARRDAEWNAPLFEFHGISVDCIDLHQPNSEARRRAYRADITYGTNNEFGFDYLRDNMVLQPEQLVQREHHFAMVDEVDSILVDDARTPLIISGPVEQGDRHEFYELKPRIEYLIEQQRKIVQQCINTAKEKIAAGAKDEKEGGLWLFRAYRGLPKYKPLIKYLSEPGIKQVMQKTEAYYLQDSSRNMHIVDEALLFTIDERHNQIELTERGIDTMAGSAEQKDLFILPDIGTLLSEIEKNKSLNDEDKFRLKEDIARNYAEKSERLHSISQLLRAYTLFEREVEYIVEEGKVLIVDENTGRVLPGRRYSDGLHQAIEAKEDVTVEDATQTFATITLQNYFRMYHKLAGMTGTAETESAELYQIYKLDVVVIPTNRPIIRQDKDDLVYKTAREKYNAIINEIIALSQAGRPVLVGTTSVETSELLSRMLKLRNIKHNVLNAKHHQREAEIVAEAGQSGVVTIATNMAGRGTDIKLGPGVKESGGLAIVGTERHESRRIDRQLRGRAGRQGDPGSSQFFVSLEDNLMRLFGSDRIAKVMDMMKVQDGEVIQHSLITKSITNAQRKVEENNFAIRKRLLEYDDVMNMQREAVYGRRKNALFGDRLKVDLDNMLFDFIQSLVEKHHPENDGEGLILECLRHLALAPKMDARQLERLSQERLTQQLYLEAKEFYQHKEKNIAAALLQAANSIRENPDLTGFRMMQVGFTDGLRGVQLYIDIDKLLETEGYEGFNLFEKTVVLGVIDERWKTHLREMDELKQSVQNAVYEQKDPLLIYKFEAYEIFKNMLGEMNQQALSLLFKAEIGQEVEEIALSAPQPQIQMEAPPLPEPEPIALIFDDEEDTKPRRPQAPPSLSKLKSR